MDKTPTDKRQMFVKPKADLQQESSSKVLTILGDRHGASAIVRVQYFAHVQN